MDDDSNVDEFVCQDCQAVGLPGACHVCGGTMVLLPKADTVETDGRYEPGIDDDDLLFMNEVVEEPAKNTDDDI